MIDLASIETFVFRYPLKTPVQTSFGLMLNRPMALVKVTDRDGVTGFGEIWCNFPNVGAEHRARLVDQFFAQLLLGQTFDSPKTIFDLLTEKSRTLALQTGETGTFAQCIAGLDIALHDLAAKQSELPLWRFLGASRNVLPIYASGLNPSSPEILVRRLRDEGYTAFKLKVGFGRAVDLRNVETLRNVLGSDHLLAVDANQGWTVAQAVKFLPELAEFSPAWVEEPIAVDSPPSDWAQVNAASPSRLAGGENLYGTDAFQAAIREGHLAIIQPDVAKWGGISGCLPLARHILDSGLDYYPHYLGGGVGLVASAHLLAAAGGCGMLEVDANPNPMRTELLGDMLSNPHKGFCLNDKPGLGIDPDLQPLKPHQTHYAKTVAA